jgi:hypothetical protein
VSHLLPPVSCSRLPLPLLALALPLLARGAHAEVSVYHQPGLDGCAEAGTYFPEDMGIQAQRARRRCRLETFEDKLQDDQAQHEAQRDRQQEQNIETWMAKQEIPNRLLHRNSIDFLVGSGLTSYGLAVGGLFLPWLEAELWVGRRSVSASTETGALWDSRTCLGGRFKWLMRGRGNLTPVTSLGAAGCSANVHYDPYYFGASLPGDMLPSSSSGNAAAHLVMGTAGLAWMEKSGFRASLEYLFSYAFYTQATLTDEMHTEDANLRTVWESRLTSNRQGIRLQVGYAF